MIVNSSLPCRCESKRVQDLTCSAVSAGTACLPDLASAHLCAQPKSFPGIFGGALSGVRASICPGKLRAPAPVGTSGMFAANATDALVVPALKRVGIRGVMVQRSQGPCSGMLEG